MSTKRWYLKGRNVSLVGSHSGQDTTYYLKILWSDKLGLTYFKHFSGDIREETEDETAMKAYKILDLIREKGYIHPDMLSKDGKEVWTKSFYPSKGFLSSRSD